MSNKNRRPQPGPPPQKATPVPTVAGSDVAPVIYFDGPVACGHFAGIIQIELAANHLIPVRGAANDVHSKIVSAGHLRGTPRAMTQLRDMLDQALAMSVRKPTPSE